MAVRSTSSEVSPCISRCDSAASDRIWSVRTVRATASASARARDWRTRSPRSRLSSTNTDTFARRISGSKGLIT